jgi:hypothetical protein
VKVTFGRVSAGGAAGLADDAVGAGCDVGCGGGDGVDAPGTDDSVGGDGTSDGAGGNGAGSDGAGGEGAGGNGDGGEGAGGDGGDGGDGEGDGGGLEAESTSEPKFCVQYRVPFVARATPTPIAWKLAFSMFARCPGEFSQPVITLLGVE